MDVKINDDCIGCGLCVVTCDAIFIMNEEESVAEVYGEVNANNIELAHEAELNCPVGAIKVKNK